MTAATAAAPQADDMPLWRTNLLRCIYALIAFGQGSHRPCFTMIPPLAASFRRSWPACAC